MLLGYSVSKGKKKIKYGRDSVVPVGRWVARYNTETEREENYQYLLFCSPETVKPQKA